MELDATFKTKVAELTAKYGTWSPLEDSDLVNHIDRMAAKKNISIETLLTTEWREFMSEEEDDVSKYKVLADCKADSAVMDKVKSRFTFLRDFNSKIKIVIPMLDLDLHNYSWSVASLVSRCRHLIFHSLKDPMFQDALNKTMCNSGDQFKLKLSRTKALRFTGGGKCDVEGRFSLFSQAMRQLMTQPNSNLMRHSQLWSTVFVGEKAQDAGGPYNESWSAFAQEIQTTDLPMFIRSQNNRGNVGVGRDMWIPNPSATNSTATLMYVMLGKLMGMAIRNKMYMAFSFPSIVWKGLVNAEITKDDVNNIDIAFMQSLDHRRNLEKMGITSAEMFEELDTEYFVITGSDGKEVPIKPNGEKIRVTWENRFEFCDLLLKFRMSEFKSQCDAIRRGMWLFSVHLSVLIFLLFVLFFPYIFLPGLSQIIPTKSLLLFTWNELEKYVCGEPEIDVELLKSCTNYSGWSETDPVVVMFWNILKSLPNAEKTMFLRFTWGRSRLPLNKSAFTSRMTITRHYGSPPDNYMPVSHTCFFQIDLPAYSSEAVMRKKLVYALYNGTAIDADDTSDAIANAALGFEDF
jgi:E3 ubiquitin-protein ligase HERC2